MFLLVSRVEVSVRLMSVDSVDDGEWCWLEGNRPTELWGLSALYTENNADGVPGSGTALEPSGDITVRKGRRLPEGREENLLVVENGRAEDVARVK